MTDVLVQMANPSKLHDPTEACWEDPKCVQVVTVKTPNGVLEPFAFAYEYKDRPPIVLPVKMDSDLRQVLEILATNGPVKKTPLYKLEEEE